MREGVRVYQAPAGERMCEDYEVFVSGESAPVYAVRVSAEPFNQEWPGYQRPMEQTEIAGAAWWDMSGRVEVEIVSRRDVERVKVRPTSRGIEQKVKGNRIGLGIERPGQFTVEVNGQARMLHLFANPMEEEPTGAGVIHFGPGVHEAGVIRLESGQTLHIAGGAVVYGAVEAEGAKGIRICGRGVLDSGRYERNWGSEAKVTPFGNIALFGCEDVEISGIVARDPNVYAITPTACRNLRIRNVKLVGLWRYNTDGFHVQNCEDCEISDSFVRSFDDGIVMNGRERDHGRECGELPCRRVLVRNCVVWNDWGRAFRIGIVNWAPEIAEITFRDCDIIHVSDVVAGMENGGRATVRDIIYEDIRVELDDETPPFVFQKERGEKYDPEKGKGRRPCLCTLTIEKSHYKSCGEVRGQMKGIVFRNVSVSAGQMLPSVIRGYDEEHVVEGVRFEGLRIGGKLMRNAEEAGVKIGKHARGVEFRG